MPNDRSQDPAWLREREKHAAKLAKQEAAKKARQGKQDSAQQRRREAAERKEAAEQARPAWVP